MTRVLVTLQILANGCIWGAKRGKIYATHEDSLIIISNSYIYLCNPAFGTTYYKRRTRKVTPFLL